MYNHKTIFAAIAIIVSTAFTNVNAQLQPAVADSFFNFVKANKNRSAIFISRNDSVVFKLNGQKSMPLASTVKIMVAVEFAKQAANNIIDQDTYIPLSELDKYYLPNTDGNAHPNWLAAEKTNQHIKEDSVKLIDVARGMIMFSSNANTEYLMDLLGFDNVKNNIQLFGLKEHSAIFPIVSSLFMYQNPKRMTEKKVLKAIKDLSEEEYCKYIFALHNQLKYDSTFKAKFRSQDLTQPMQKLWSDRLTSSTVEDYVQIAKILNQRRYLDEKAYRILADILEYPMENKNFQAAFKHYGVKGGSTQFVLTHVIYLTTKNDKRMELAIFFNNLTPEEEHKLEGWLDPFEAQVIFDANFRKKLVL